MLCLLSCYSCQLHVVGVSVFVCGNVVHSCGDLIVTANKNTTHVEIICQQYKPQ